MCPSSMGQRRVRAGEDVQIDSNCAEDEKNNLEENDGFLSKENAEEHNG